MIESCIICGSSKPGKQYNFRYGRTVSVASEHYGQISETITRFKLLGSNTVAICDDCVHSQVRRHVLIWAAAGSAIAILAAGICRVLSHFQVTGSGNGFAFMVVSIALVLILLGLGMVASNVWMCLSGRCTDYAEQIAIAARKKELAEEKRADVFWTTRQFTRLRSSSAL